MPSKALEAFIQEHGLGNKRRCPCCGSWVEKPEKDAEAVGAEIYRRTLGRVFDGVRAMPARER